jgi:phospholipid/cholesterol/gamma-HCH transport system ATP-binding protein
MAKKSHEPYENNEKAVVIKHLKKGFDDNPVLEDVSLTLERGENLVILGKSGSGKSVLIKCLVGLLEPDEGEIYLLGKNMKKLSRTQLDDLRTKVGFLFQGGALYDSMTVRENLLFPIRRKLKMNREEEDTQVKKVLDQVGLLSAIDKMPEELSGGMKKRIGLARTLILNPDLILYDEPTTGLDPVTSEEISKLIVNVQNNYQASSIIITHDIKCAKYTANRMLVLKDGYFIEEGSYDDMLNSSNEFVRSFFK